MAWCTYKGCGKPAMRMRCDDCKEKERKELAKRDEDAAKKNRDIAYGQAHRQAGWRG